MYFDFHSRQCGLLSEPVLSFSDKYVYVYVQHPPEKDDFETTLTALTHSSREFRALYWFAFTPVTVS